MRGSDESSGSLFSYVDLEARVRGDHPLRTIREIAKRGAERSVESLRDTLQDFGPALDCAGEAASGDAAAGLLRHPLRAPMMERLEFDLLFRWFVGLGVDDAVWTIRPSPKIATGCWTERSPRSSWRRCWRSQR